MQGIIGLIEFAIVVAVIVLIYKKIIKPSKERKAQENAERVAVRKDELQGNRNAFNVVANLVRDFSDENGELSERLRLQNPYRRSPAYDMCYEIEVSEVGVFVINRTVVDGVKREIYENTKNEEIRYSLRKAMEDAELKKANAYPLAYSFAKSGMQDIKDETTRNALHGMIMEELAKIPHLRVENNRIYGNFQKSGW